MIPGRSVVRAVVWSCVGAGAIPASGWQPQANEIAQPANAGRKRALLVAPTDYPFAPGGAIPALWGPPQDADLFAKVLREEFGFAGDDIRVLSAPLGGWESTPQADRPTRANVEREFKRLADESGADDQVVILLALHGTQQNLDPHNPDRTEADGMDEVLLPADATAMQAGDTAIPNGIVDNEIRVWLQAIAAKGAQVWIIFDACCSGGAWRAAGGEERYRFVPPERLGIQRRGLPRASASRTRGVEDTAQEAGDIDPGMQGIVAFYAARSDLSAPESPLAAVPGQPVRPQDYHGWLTYSICQVLAARQGPLNYRELAQQVLGRYRVRPIPESPFPYGEGDLDREVLGERVWRERSRIVVRNVENGELLLTAGSLLGLARGSILAVYPKAGDAQPPDALLGYMEVTAAEPATARARPVAWNDREPARPEVLLDGRCEIAMFNYGDARVAIAVQQSDPDASERSPSGAARTLAAGELPPLVAAALARLPEGRRELLQLVDQPAVARLLLRVEGERVRLLPANGEFVGSDGAAVDRSRGQFFVLERPDAAALAERLSETLQRYFKWHNLIALASHPSVRGGALGLTLELVRIDGEQRVPVGPNEPVLLVGDQIEIRVRNAGSQPLDVTLLVLDEGLGITPFFPDPNRADECTIEPGGQRVFAGVTVSDETLGRESLVAIAAPTLKTGGRQEFTWLAQPSLREATRGLTERGRGETVQTPFARLLASGAFADANPAQRTRSLKQGPSPAAAMAVVSWETRRPAAP